MPISARVPTSGVAASGAGFTITLPVGTVVGDVVVLGVGNAGTAGPATPSGWSLQTNSSAGTGQNLAIYTAPYSAGLTLNFTNAASAAAWVCNAYCRPGASVVAFYNVGGSTSGINDNNIFVGRPSTSSLANGYEVIICGWTSNATITGVATGTSIDAQQANGTAVSVALGHNNQISQPPSTQMPSFTEVLSSPNSRKSGVGITLEAFVSTDPTATFGGPVDDFNAASLNTGTWTVWGTGTQDQSGGTLNQSATPSSTNYIGVYSNTTYDLTNKSVLVDISQLPSSTAGSQAYLRCEVDSSNAVLIGYSDGNFFCQHQLAGVTTSLFTTAWPGGTRRLRLVFDNVQSRLWFDSSVDGVNWTNRFREAIPIATTALRVLLGTGTYQAVASPGTTKFDNLNVLPYKNLTGTSTAAGITSALIGNKSERVRPPYIRQIVTGQIYDASEITVPLQPTTPGSMIWVVMIAGPAGSSHPNTGSPSPSSSPQLLKQGVSQMTGTLRAQNASTGKYLWHFGFATTAGSTTQSGVGMAVRVFCTGGNFGEWNVTVLEIQGLLAGASAYQSSYQVLSGTSTTASPTVTVATYESSMVIADVANWATVSGATMTQTGMPGKPWQRIEVQTDGSAHFVHAIDILVGQSNVGSQTIQPIWTLPTSVTWQTASEYLRGPAPGLTGTAVGFAVTSTGRTNFGVSNGVAVTTGQITAKLPTISYLTLPTDDFSTGALGAQWAVTNPSNGAVDVVGGTLNLSAPTTSAEIQVLTTAAYDLRNKTVVCEYVQRSTLNTFNYSGIRIIDTTSNIVLEFGQRDTSLYVTQGGGFQFSMPWPTGLRAIRITITDTLSPFGNPLMIFWYSTDGASWMPCFSKYDGYTTYVKYGSCKIGFCATNSFASSNPAPGTVKFDNLNVYPFPWVVYKSLTGFAVGQSSGGNYRSTVLADSPIGYWRLGETSGTAAADSSGRAHTGTYASTGVTLNQPSSLAGDANPSVLFAGTSGQSGTIGVPSHADWRPVGGGWSMEAWIKPTALSGTQEIMRFGGGDGWFLRLSGDQVGTLWGMQGGVFPTPQGGSVPAANVWSHIAATYDGQFIRHFINGKQVFSVAETRVFGPTYTGKLAIASQDPDNGGELFFGGLDEVAVYNYALSPGQVSAHYTAGLNTPSTISRKVSIVGTSAGVATETVNVINVSRLITANPSTGIATVSGSPFSMDDYGLAIYNHANNIAFWRLGEAVGTTTARDSSKTGGHNATYIGQGTASYNNAVLATSGLVAYWHLDETSGTAGNDSKGIAHGVYQGTPVLGQAGIPNNTTSSVKFGPNNYLRIPYASPATDPLRLANGPLTVEAWIKRNTLNGQNNGIISTGTDGYYLRLNNANQLQFLRSQIAVVATSSTTITDLTTWHHVVATKSGSTTKLFLDGVELAATVTDATLANSTFPYFYVGSELNGTETFDGWMDEVAVYNVALSPAQIASHYSVGSSAPSGLGYAGAISGGTDKSVNFDGIDDYIDIPDFALPATFTVEAWLKVDTLPVNTCLINRRTVGNVGGFTLECGSNGIFIWYVYTDSFHGTVSTRAIAPGVWNHIVGVYHSGGSTLLMINGEDCGRLSGIGTLNNPVGALFQIARNAAGGQVVDGQIDEIAIYNINLPDQTIRDHYHLGIKARDPYGAAVDRTSGLVAYLRLEEPTGSVFDSSSNGHSGTVGTPGVAYGTTGSLFTGDKGLTFNGVATTYVDLSDVGSTLDIAGDLTLECWVKVANFANYWMFIINSDAPATRALYEYRTEATTGMPSLLQANGTVWQFSTAGAGAIAPPLNVWNHMVVTRLGNTVQHYLNGVANGAAIALTGAVPAAPATNPVKLGARLDAGVNSYPLVGSMDEVAIYSRALTLTEIQEHYNKGISGTWKVSVVGTAPGLSTVSAQATRRRSLVATSIGISTTTATATRRRPLTAASPGTATANAQIIARRAMVAAAAGQTTVAVTLTKILPYILPNPSNGVSTTTAIVTRRRPITGVSAGAATEVGQPSGKRSIVAVSAGITSVSGSLVRTRALVVLSVGAATEVGEVSKKVLFPTVTSAGKATTTGTASLKPGRIYPNVSAGVATVSAVLTIRSATIPPVTIVGRATVSVSITDKRAIVALAAGKSTNAGVPTRRKAIIAASAGVGVATGTVTRRRSLVVSAAGVATIVGIIQRRVNLSALSSGTASVSAILLRKRLVFGTANGLTTVLKPTLLARRAVRGTSNGKTNAVGRPINVALILWNGSTFTIAGNYPVVLWDQAEFEVAVEEGEVNVDYVAYKGSTDQFNPIEP